MKIEKNDLVNADNLLKLLKKASVSLEGEEILAAAESFKWLYKHFMAMKTEFEKPPVEMKEATPPIVAEKPKKKKD